MDARDCLVSYVVPVYNKALTYRQVRPGACLAAAPPVGCRAQAPMRRSPC
jgi:hypothetical protein